MFVSPVGFFAINAVTAMSPFSQYLLSFLHVSLVTPPPLSFRGSSFDILPSQDIICDHDDANAQNQQRDFVQI